MLFIRGYKIPARKEKIEVKKLLKLLTEEEDFYTKIYCDSDFPQHVLPEEETYYRYKLRDREKNDKCVAEVELASSHLNEIKRNLARIFLNKTLEEVWNECQKTKADFTYPSGLYFLLDFPDNEGTIGPTAVKAMNNFFTPEVIAQVEADPKFKASVSQRKFQPLLEAIEDTAKEKRGYLRFE